MPARTVHFMARENMDFGGTLQNNNKHFIKYFKIWKRASLKVGPWVLMTGGMAFDAGGMAFDPGELLLMMGPWVLVLAPWVLMLGDWVLMLGE